MSLLKTLIFAVVLPTLILLAFGSHSPLMATWPWVEEVVNAGRQRGTSQRVNPKKTQSAGSEAKPRRTVNRRKRKFADGGEEQQLLFTNGYRPIEVRPLEATPKPTRKRKRKPFARGKEEAELIAQERVPPVGVYVSDSLPGLRTPKVSSPHREPPVSPTQQGLLQLPEISLEPHPSSLPEIPSLDKLVRTEDFHDWFK